MHGVLVRDETGRITSRLKVDLGPGEVLITSADELAAGRFTRVREFIVLTHDGFGARRGRMDRRWKPLSSLGYTGSWRGDVELAGFFKYREQHWELNQV